MCIRDRHSFVEHVCAVIRKKIRKGSIHLDVGSVVAESTAYENGSSVSNQSGNVFVGDFGTARVDEHRVYAQGQVEL